MAGATVISSLAIQPARLKPCEDGGGHGGRGIKECGSGIRGTDVGVHAPADILARQFRCSFRASAQRSGSVCPAEPGYDRRVRCFGGAQPPERLRRRSLCASSIKELASHMRGLFLRLETRKEGRGPPTHHLVHTVTPTTPPPRQ